MRKKTLLIIFGLALVLRIILIVNPGFEADISFWKSWGLATYDKGIVEGMKVTNNNYPTPFAYVLGGMVWVYSRFADPHNFNEFWSDTNVWFLFVSKMVPILADFGIAFLILFIGKNAKRLGFPDFNPRGWETLSPGIAGFGLSFYELAATVYLFSPLSLMDGAWWGQVDSLGVFTFLLALLALLKRKPFLTGFLFILAMMTKLQNMIYGPVFFLFIWQLTGYSGLIQAIGGALVGFFGLNIEFFLTRNMDRVLSSLTQNFDYFPWMSLNAFNVWWIVAGGHGMQVSDKLLAIGVANAKTVGLIVFSSFYLFAALQQFFTGIRYQVSGIRQERKQNAGGWTREQSRVIGSFLISLLLINSAFFLFQTQSHDRYAFPISVFFLLWVPFIVERFPKYFWAVAVSYLLFTAVYFYNLHTALVVNYPNNGLPLLSSLTQPVFTIPASVVLLLLFGWFVLFLFSFNNIFKITFLISGLAGTLLLTLVNKPLVTNQPMSLTKFIPYISEQAYGTRQTDRSVQSSFGGPNGWTRLSVQYVFYRLGFGTHANSRNVFDIGKHFTRFTADFGIDTEAGTRASAVFAIYGDDKLLYQSPKMGRFDLPKHADVNVTGVRFLSLVTNDAGDGNFDDHTDWLNPILWP